MTMFVLSGPCGWRSAAARPAVAPCHFEKHSCQPVVWRRRETCLLTELPQTRDDPGDGRDDLVDVFLAVVLAEAEADGGAGEVARQTHGDEDVGRFERADS